MWSQNRLLNCGFVSNFGTFVTYIIAQKRLVVQSFLVKSEQWGVNRITAAISIFL